MDPFRKLDEDLNPATQGKDTENAEIQKTFRDLFITEQGRKVLNVLLNDMCYFQPCKTEGETALRNYATFLLEERMGYKDTISLTNKILEADFE